MSKWKCYLKLIWLSLKAIFKVNLGDVVIYGGEKWSVANGVTFGMWKLRKLYNPHVEIEVKATEIRKAISLLNVFRSFISTWLFYKTSWFSSWLREGFELSNKIVKDVNKRKEEKIDEK